jgi:hypothetical protein
MNLAMSESDVLDRCRKEGVGVSALELLPSGGVRLVCMSSDGADTIRRIFPKKLIQGAVVRERFRPTRPLW